MSIKNRFEKWFYLRRRGRCNTKQAASRRAANGKGRARRQMRSRKQSTNEQQSQSPSR